MNNYTTSPVTTVAGSDELPERDYSIPWISPSGGTEHPTWCQQSRCEAVGVERSRLHRAHVMQIHDVDTDTSVYAKLIQHQIEPTGLAAPQVELWFTEQDEGWCVGLDGHSAWLSLTAARRLYMQLGEQIALAEAVNHA